jgi:hypothetical protein
MSQKLVQTTDSGCKPGWNSQTPLAKATTKACCRSVQVTREAVWSLTAQTYWQWLAGESFDVDC